jgi:hypothetical protein
MTLPRSFGGKADVTIAIPVPKIMADPIPCSKRAVMSIGPDTEIPHASEAMATMIFPIIKMRLRPIISAIFPAGTNVTADESKKAIAIQLIHTAFMLNSCPIFGNAMLTAAPIKGFRKEVITLIDSKIDLFTGWEGSISFGYKTFQGLSHSNQMPNTFPVG